MVNFPVLFKAWYNLYTPIAISVSITTREFMPQIKLQFVVLSPSLSIHMKDTLYVKMNKDRK